MQYASYAYDRFGWPKPEVSNMWAHIVKMCSLPQINWIGLCMVLRPRQHSIGYMGYSFTGQKTQPTVSKY